MWGWAEVNGGRWRALPSVSGRLFHVSYTPRGISYLLHRLGWSPQVPQRRAAERNEEQVATWVKETWPLVEQRRGIRTRGSASPTRQDNR
ncbi:winged helix-turn-helix domain-containing protein [Nonomuraea sp. NPDC050790]|uniref:winged helix-turn-helix domain-containing protein n=1 Tax=Nonomuraea sp. NPDC050790 TaxID=3364371 RepID=UPI00378A7182